MVRTEMVRENNILDVSKDLNYVKTNRSVETCTMQKTSLYWRWTYMKFRKSLRKNFERT